MIESLLERISNAGFRTKVIEALDRNQVLVWWADLYHPLRGGRKHGYGPTMVAALGAALEAEEAYTSAPTYFRHHEVVEVKVESTFVRRF